MKPNCNYKRHHIILFNLRQATSCPVLFFCLLVIPSTWPLGSLLSAALTGSAAVSSPISHSWQAADTSWKLISIYVTSHRDSH